jgi:uncharacterized membrane protein
MWLTIGKVALVAFLALAIALSVVVYVRHARTKGFPTWESISHLDQIRGAMPPMPRRDGIDDPSDDCSPPPRH